MALSFPLRDGAEHGQAWASVIWQNFTRFDLTHWKEGGGMVISILSRQFLEIITKNIVFIIVQPSVEVLGDIIHIHSYLLSAFIMFAFNIVPTQ